MRHFDEVFPLTQMGRYLLVISPLTATRWVPSKGTTCVAGASINTCIPAENIPALCLLAWTTILFFGILIVLTFSYCCIFRLIRRKEKKIKTYDIPLAVVYSNTNHTFHEYHKNPNDKGPDIDCNDIDARSRQKTLGERKHVALGKSAAVL